MQRRTIRTLLFALVVLVMSTASFAQLRVSVTFGPPALPVYEQPLCPSEGYIWVPGYWAWDDYDGDYYWVPGTWVLPPQAELLWTPPYWAWVDGAFLFYDGYWGPRVGFYGGINYGFGYFGEGFVGGRWDGGRFFYNRSVTNVNVTEIHNVYNTTVINNSTTINRVSYNGGQGGVVARPTPQQEAIARERHFPPVASQTQHLQAARSNPEFRAASNHGRPPVAATARPAQFAGREAVPAREAGAPYNPPANRGAGRPSNGRPNNPEPGRGNAGRPFTHPNELPPFEKPTSPNSGNAKIDQKYMKQQEKLQQQQDKERQKLQQQQDREHQRVAKQNADEARKQQMEQRHEQQTQQLQQRQAQAQQRMQQRQPPPRPEGRPEPPRR